MPPISRTAGQDAFAHVKTLLEQAAGRDGIVSRADAAQLIDELRTAGRGTEALAAEQIFAAIDLADTTRGARVTGYDLRAHAPVIDEMLEDADLNLDGVLSRAEIEQLKGAGKALLELGQVLRLEARPGRVAHRIPQQGMEHVAALINRASTDGIISRADKDALVDKLTQSGRGTEALAVAFWFGHIDHRDAKKGARVTSADIEKALAYADKKFLRSKDENRNGYSQKEIGRFSTSAKAFLLIGQMIEGGVLRPAQDRPALLASGREVLTERTAEKLAPRFAELAYTLALDEHVATRARFTPGQDIDLDRAYELHAGVFGGTGPSADYQAMTGPQLFTFLDTKFGLAESADTRRAQFDALLADLRTAHGDDLAVFVAAGAEAGTEEGAEVLLVFGQQGVAYGLDLMV